MEQKKESKPEQAPKKEAQDYVNQLKRLQAEFENYQKRVEKERKKVSENATDQLIVKLLNIIDDFERALIQLKQTPETAEQSQGVQMIYNNLLKILQSEGVKVIEATGQKADPYKHEVINQMASEKEEGTVVQELQKGYARQDRVLRYSKVMVAKKNGGK